MRHWLSLGILTFWVGTQLSPALAWDDYWTQGRSGITAPYDNPGSTEGKAGTDPPQKYYSPNPRDTVRVDPEELDDYFGHLKKDYAPYALARITQALHYNGLEIPKGYYLIKPGNAEDGSPQTNLGTENLSQSLPPLATPGNAKAPKVNPKKPPPRVFVILAQGKVVAVVPIHRMALYQPARKDKIPRHALAWMEIEERRPVLKFYYRKHLYTTEFE